MLVELFNLYLLVMFRIFLKLVFNQKHLKNLKIVIIFLVLVFVEICPGYGIDLGKHSSATVRNYCEQ